MGMANLQRMAMQMQQSMERVKGELAEATVDGSAGGGVVKAVATGDQKLVSITIDPSAVDPADVEMLQDLISAAFNEAIKKVDDMMASEMGKLTGGLNLPPGML